MDWRSLIGLLIAVAAIMLGYRLDGGDIAALFQPAGLLVVAAGTVGALWLQCGPTQCWRALRLLRSGFAHRDDRQAELSRKLRLWSATVRRSGVLALEQHKASMDLALDPVLDAFAARGLRLLVDGASSEQIRAILENDTDSFDHQQRQLIRIWENAGGTAPTMGILGAVLGLVQVMQHLADPSLLGPGIAVAFVSTLYGVGVANLVFLPIAARLKERLAQELRERDQLAAALVAIAEGEAAHVVEERLSLMRGAHATTTR